MNRDSEYRFSIVIPCHNEANFIADTLDSLSRQDTTSKYEVIIVDNNCTDETVKIARQYSTRVVTEKRAGVCWARQAGTQAARGEIIISTDADTLFSDNWLSVIDKTFKYNKKVIAVSGPCRYIDGPWWGKFYTHILFTISYIYSLIIGHPFYITATNTAFKKSAWQSYNTECMQGGDELDLLHNLRTKGRVQFLNRNPTYTSGRRLSRGLLYNIFVTFIFYYLGAYYLNKMFKRTIIGSAPAFRDKPNSLNANAVNIGFTTLVIVLLIGFMSLPQLRHFMSDNAQDTSTAFKGIVKDLI
jgi:glycosyltransferase involved in cell wall biosynthesis